MKQRIDISASHGVSNFSAKAVSEVCQAINASNPNKSVIADAPRGLIPTLKLGALKQPTIDELKFTPGNKASAPMMTEAHKNLILPWEKVGEFYYNTSPTHQELGMFKNIDDSQTSLSGTDRLDYDSALKNFDDLIRTARSYCKEHGIEDPLMMTVDQRMEFMRKSKILP